MTDSRPTQFIRPSVLIDPAKTSASEQRPNILIISLQPELQKTDKPIALDGKIIETKSDGTVRIMTESGEIVAKPEKPLNIPNGERVEIRLPKGEPPATAYVRPAPPEKPQMPEAPTRPQETIPQIKLPPAISLQELVSKIETVLLKSLPPQQIAKIIVPYLSVLKTVLPQNIPEISVDLLTPTNKTQTLISQEIGAPLAPITAKPLPVTSVLPPKIISDFVEQGSVLITTTQGLLEFLKAENPEALLKAKLIPLPLEIAPRSLLAGLIAKPLAAPISTPVIPSLPATPASAKPEVLAQFTSFEILSILPPAVMQTQPTIPAIQNISQPEIIAAPSIDTPAVITENSIINPSVLPSTITPPIDIPIAQDILPPELPKDLLQPMIKEATDIAVKPDTIQAVVVGFTPEQNFPVLQIVKPEARTDQFFALELPIRDIPLGTQIELRIQQTATTATPQIPVSPPPSLIAAPVLPLSYFLTPDSWSTLQEIQSVLTQVAPQAATTFNAILPQANNPQRLGPAALFFLVALRNGDLSNWIGDNAVNALKKAGKSDLLTRLSTEMSSLSRLSSDNISQEWRMSTIPLSWNNDIQKIVIYYKKDGREQNQDEKKNGGGTRFLMNLNLSQIGPLQLDGLFHADKKRLDLMLRTQIPFSAPMQGEMRRLYKEALDETLYTGELTFQNKPEQWVHITPYNRAAFSEKI